MLSSIYVPTYVICIFLKVVKETIEWIFRALVSSCCGTLIYMNINREKEARIAQNNSMKNTFWPFFLHMILCFVEHLVVVSFKYASQFGKKVDFRKIISMMSFCWLGKTPIHRIQKFSLNTTCL